ncbi:MAG: gamma-glutamyltransferase [Solirubrobacteraceae bacterium]
MLRDGGNAADAALAAAAVLCVTEPMMTGVGGDAFAIVYTRDGQVDGLDAAGPAPANAPPGAPVAWDGPTSVTVPGAVAGWAALAERHARFGLDRHLRDAVDHAERGFEVQPYCARYWQHAPKLPQGYAPAPNAGDWVRLPELGATLQAIAEHGPDAVYRGRIAEAIVEASWLELEDLASYQARWVEPLSRPYRAVDVYEMPPPTQGMAALEALANLEGMEPTLANQVECVRRALGRAFAGGDTVYLCAVDDDGMAVSFIQSLFGAFGAGITAGGTGVVLQNRGACFEINGAVEPGRRPFHTIIPGLLLHRDGTLLGPFGVMGGFLQAQAHVQLVSALVDDGLDPQAALDRPRFRVEGDRVALEPGLADHAGEIPNAYVASDVFGFGGGQAILMGEHGELRAGSDRRKDGYAAFAS